MSQSGTIRVLLIRFSSMGDVILTSPVVRALHAMLEGGVEVHFLTKSAFVDAVDGLEGVHKVWSIEKTTAEVELDLVELGFHYVVDLHANARSAFIKRALRRGNTLDLTVNKRSLEKMLLVRFGRDRLGGQHVVERYLATLDPFGSALSALGGVEDNGALRLPALEAEPRPAPGGQGPPGCPCARSGARRQSRSTGALAGGGGRIGGAGQGRGLDWRTRRVSPRHSTVGTAS